MASSDRSTSPLPNVYESGSQRELLQFVPFSKCDAVSYAHNDVQKSTKYLPVWNNLRWWGVQSP